MGIMFLLKRWLNMFDRDRKGLTLDKLRMMTTKELHNERRKYNKKDHEFILYVIDHELKNREV